MAERWGFVEDHAQRLYAMTELCARYGIAEGGSTNAQLWHAVDALELERISEE